MTRRALGWLAAGALAFAAAPALAQELRIVAERLHPVAGEVIENGAVLVRDGRIVAVGPAAGVPAVAGGEELRAAVVVPGFIDVQSSVGLAAMRNIASQNDENETTAPDRGELRAIDAFDPREPLLRVLLEHGVTLVQAGPGPALPIAGQAGIFRTLGESADAMAVRFPSAMVFNLGEAPKQTFDKTVRGTRTRMGTAALIRQRLTEARSSGSVRAWLRGADLQLDALSRVVSGEVPALFVAHRADDIETALRIAREFGLRAWLGGATEAYRIPDLVAGSGVPVLAGPVMERPASPQSEAASYEAPALLRAAGIPFGFRSGYEAYVPRNRLVWNEAQVAVANGLAPADALRALTLDAARILALDADHGSLEVGKAADMVLFDGDPFEYTTHVEAVVVDGRTVHRRTP